MIKKSEYCPFGSGCEIEDQICMFWRKRKGCELEALIHDLRVIPNLLRRIEKALEEGKHIQ